MPGGPMTQEHYRSPQDLQRRGISIDYHDLEQKLPINYLLVYGSGHETDLPLLDNSEDGFTRMDGQEEHAQEKQDCQDPGYHEGRLAVLRSTAKLPAGEERQNENKRDEDEAPTG
jgi:hypothetical protein